MEETLVLPHQLLSSSQIMTLLSRMLLQINPSLGKTSVQSAYITAKILQNLPVCGLTLKDSVLISLCHMFGFYHFMGEEVLNRSSLTSEDAHRYFTYGYYYLKEMTPAGENARSLLFFDSKYDRAIANKVRQVEYASLIFSSESIQRMIENTNGDYAEPDLENYGFTKYNPRYLNTFRKLDLGHEISKKIVSGEYLPELERIYNTIDFTDSEKAQLLKVLVYVIDFKSTQTVQHIIHTAGYAAAIGRAMGCSFGELDELYTAGLLHDLGKVSIPNLILECGGKLSPFEYRVMKMHIVETENLLKNVVDEKIIQIAARHHEKLNGKGYPNGLTAKDLTIQQQIMTVADIFSALVDKRSYKGKFPKEKVVEIFQEEADNGAIDKNIPRFIDNYYDTLISECNFYGTLLTVPLGKVEYEFQEEMDSELEDLG